MPQIQYKDPESEKIVSIDIDAGMPVITIGRNPGNVIRVNNPSISRQHAKIVWEHNTCTLIDLDSSNGSYVNGQQIKSQVLQTDDRLRVGEFPLDFVTENIVELAPDQASMSHEDIDIGDILSSAEVDDVLFDDSLEPNISEASSVVFENSAPPIAPIDNPSSFDSEFGAPSEVSLSEVSAIEPVMINDPDLTGSEDMNIVSNQDGGIYPSPELSLPSEPSFAQASEPSFAQASEPSFTQASEPSFAQASEPSFAQAADPVLSSAPQIDTSEFELRINELTTERDELLDLLQSRAGDAGGAAKVQIDRLRAERDRLIEERRNLQRTQRDLRTQLDSFPPLEEWTAFTAELNQLREKDQHHETRVTVLQGEIGTHLETIEALNLKGEAQENTISELQTTLGQNANLAENLENALAEIQNFDSVKQQLEEEIARLKNDGASSLERDQDQLSKIASLENENANKAETISMLENEKEELMKRSLELDNLREEHKATQLELQARPVAEEVQAIIADLASARAVIETSQQKIEELEGIKTELDHKIELADQAQAEFDSRFNRQGEQLAEAQRAFSALKTEKEAFARETDYLMGAKRNYDSEIRGAQKRVQELEKNDRRKKKIFDELRSDLEVLIGENTILQSTIEGLEKEVASAPSSDDLQASISLSKERDEEIAGLKLTISDLEDELENQTKLAKVEGDKSTDLDAKLKESESELEALRIVASQESNSSEENEKLSKKNSENEKALKKINKELENAKSKSEKKQEEITKLKEDNKTLKKELSALSKNEASQGKEAEEKIAALEKQVAETEEALAEIILQKDKLEDQIAGK